MEKYFEDDFIFDEFEAEEKQKFLVVVIYDIFDDKRRTKFSKFLKQYGTRIQRSSFECFLTNILYQKLVTSIPTYLSSKDLIKVYKLRGDAMVKTWGIQEETLEEDFIII